MRIQSQGPLQDLGGVFFFGAPLADLFSGPEALLTRCSYEADGKNFFFLPELN